MAESLSLANRVESDIQLSRLLDAVVKDMSKDDLALLQRILADNEGREVEVLEELLGFAYRWKPVGVREFVEGERYLNMRGQVYPVLLDDLEELFDSGKYEEAVFCGGIGFGKCLMAGTLVPTTTGVKKIEDIIAGEKVASIDSRGNVLYSDVAATSTTIKDCYEYSFNGTLKLSCSADHPVLTQRGYVRIGELLQTDYVASVKHKIGSSEFDPYLVKWLAYMVAEGATKGNSTFTNGTPEVIMEFYECCAKLGFDIKVIAECTNYSQLRVNGCRDTLREHGLFDKLAKEKQIPEYIWEHGAEAIALFLNRFFACDGSVHRKSPIMIECSLASEKLIDDIVLACRMLGVYGRKVYNPKSCGDKIFDAWTFSITDSNMVKRFISVCGEIYTKPIGVELNNSNNVNKDITPVGYSEMKELRKLVGGISKKEWGKYQIPTNQHVGRKRSIDILDAFGDVLPDYWHLWLNPNISWEKLESVKPLGEQTLYDIYVPENHNFIANGVIVHNSTLAEISICRMVYNAACLRNPQMAYGLAAGTTLHFVNVSITKQQAKDVVFKGIKTKMGNSPFFRKEFPFEKELAEELRFPNNIHIAPTVDPIGLNVLGGVIDEANFMDVVEDSSRAAGGKYDRAKEIHDMTLRRMKSRFMRKGKLPGILITISSSRYPDDFTERKMEEAKENPSIFARRYSQWGTKPSHFFIGETFDVALGNMIVQPDIVKAPEEEQIYKDMGIQIIKVPIEYKKDFETDIYGAIRDLAGMPTASIHPFIIYRHKIFEAMSRGKALGMEHPYTLESTTIKDGALLIPEKIKVHNKPCYIHTDLAIKKDAAGFAMGHVDKWIKITRRNEEGKEVNVIVPVIIIDFMLRIIPPQNGEIDIAAVRGLVHQFRAMGFNIQKATYDQFNSAESIQQLNRVGIKSELLSVDRNQECYGSLKDAMYEDRLIMYEYAPLANELVHLEINEKTGKVDHPANNYKDVSDAVAGVCYHCTVEKPSIAMRPEYGQFLGEDKVAEKKELTFEERERMLDEMMFGGITNVIDSF